MKEWLIKTLTLDGYTTHEEALSNGLQLMHVFALSIMLVSWQRHDYIFITSVVLFGLIGAVRYNFQKT
ncbi:MAG: hypothetical protein IJV62_02175 [Eggerthellaceae bacterium]|nr:hypothetical protein [Eggerthellaceae bacterium]